MVCRRLALVMAYGPEARAFLQSGLAARLAEQWEVLVVTTEPASRAFLGRLEPVLPLPCLEEGPPMLRVRNWSRGLSRRAPALAAPASQAERIAGRWIGGGQWARFFAQQGIAAVVTASATGGRTLPALQAAANLGIPSAVLLNSWKDLHGRARLPAPISALGVVTSADLHHPQARSGIPAALCGSLHHAAARSAPALSRRDFCQARGLDPARPILCYAMAADDPGEQERIAWLARRLARTDARPQLLIRTNPMLDDPDRLDPLAAIPGLVLVRPRWEWSRPGDWCCPLPEDLPLWRATLEHSALAITLPSTIALDFAAWGKPTVNIAWGPGTAPWSAESYAPIRRAPATFAATSSEQALALITDLLHGPPPLEPHHDDPVSAALQLLDRAFANPLSQARTRTSAVEAVAR